MNNNEFLKKLADLLDEYNMKVVTEVDDEFTGNYQIILESIDPYDKVFNSGYTELDASDIYDKLNEGS